MFYLEAATVETKAVLDTDGVPISLLCVDNPLAWQFLGTRSTLKLPLLQEPIDLLNPYAF